MRVRVLTIDNKLKRKSKNTDPKETDPKKTSSRETRADKKVQAEEEAYRRSAEEKVARRWGILSYLLPGLGVDEGMERLPDPGAGGDGVADAGLVDDWGDVDELGFDDPNDGQIDDAVIEADADAIAADLGVNNDQNFLEDSPSAEFDADVGDEFEDATYELDAVNAQDEQVVMGEDDRGSRPTAGKPKSALHSEKASASQAASLQEAESHRSANSAMKSVLSSLTLNDLGFGVPQLRALVRTLYERDRHAERERWRAAHSKVRVLVMFIILFSYPKHLLQTLIHNAHTCLSDSQRLERAYSLATESSRLRHQRASRGSAFDRASNSRFSFTWRSPQAEAEPNTPGASPLHIRSSSQNGGSAVSASRNPSHENSVQQAAQADHRKSRLNV